MATKIEYRNACFTLNNWEDSEREALINWNWKGKPYYKYIVFGEEVGENGTPHLQGYVEFPNSRTLDVLKKFNPRIHWEKRLGTASRASDYCKKGEQTHQEWVDFGVKGPTYGQNAKVFEAGTISKAGHRTDLEDLAHGLQEGTTTVDEIALDNPYAFHEFGRTLSKVEDLMMRKKFRTWMTICIWYHGPTGTGKSERAFEGFNPETHYVFPNDNGWWDGYAGQEVVIINDFRGDLIKYNELLQLVDKYPMTVKRRCREPMPFLAKKVIITSSLPPEEVFKWRHENDSIAQLLRRCTVVCTGQTAEVAKGNTGALAVDIFSAE